MIPLHLIQILLVWEVFDDEEIIAAINSIKAVAQFFDQNSEQLKRAGMLRELTAQELKVHLKEQTPTK